jgi:hypothetical protein
MDHTTRGVAKARTGQHPMDWVALARTNVLELQNRCAGESSQAGSIPVRSPRGERRVMVEPQGSTSSPQSRRKASWGAEISQRCVALNESRRLRTGLADLGADVGPVAVQPPVVQPLAAVVQANIGSVVRWRDASI